MSAQPSSEFEKAAQDNSNQGFISDCWYFLYYSKKWWLLPILLVLALLGAMVLLSGSAAAPFIYTLF
jgi:hypothetical protein